MTDALDIPADWSDAIERIGAGDFSRVVVIGATDTGKSSFVRALLAAAPERELIDVDPGQKLVGPPGTVSLGRLGAQGLDLGGFVFTGSTSPTNIFLITRACTAMAAASPRFVANTSGFVEHLGARLQAATISALDADLVVAIGDESAVAPILAKHGGRPVLRLRASAKAATKTAAARARLRQAALDAALAGGESLAFAGIAYEPAPPIAIDLAGRHPICSLADAEGTDLAIGVVEAAADGSVRVFARAPERPVRTVRLGRMWAVPEEGGWSLLETLHPSWIHDEPEG